MISKEGGFLRKKKVEKDDLQLGEGPPRAPAAREAGPGTISGGALPPRTPPFFFLF